MKKIISVLLVILMLVPAFCVQSFAGMMDSYADFEKDGVYYYEADDGKVYAYAYEEQEEGSAPVELVIPETIKNGKKTYTVTGIGFSAFEASNYSKITLPDTISYIGDYAFYKTNIYSDIVLPESVVSVGKYAFAECKGILTMTLPSSMLKIPEGMFKNCLSLTAVYTSGVIKEVGAAYEAKIGYAADFYVVEIGDGPAKLA